MVLRLANGKARYVTVPTTPFVMWEFLNTPPTLEVGACEGDDKLVGLALWLENRLDRHSYGQKHVISLEDLGSVQDDGGYGVKAVKDKGGIGILRDCGGGKSRLVDPVHFANPLDVKLVLPDKGVGDELVCEEVEVNLSGEPGNREEA